MKEIVELLSKKKYIYKSFKEVDKKALKTKKKVMIYEAIDLDGYYTAVFHLKQKSRFLRKNAGELDELHERLKVYKDHNFKKKIFAYALPICSLAKKEMADNGWILIDAVI